MGKKKLRGIGFKHSLSAVFPMTAIWVVVVVLTAPVMTGAMIMGGLVPESSYPDVWIFLLTRVPLLAVAAIGLAVFTTSRSVGALVRMKRTFEEIRDGDMDARMSSFRRGDRHFSDAAQSFNAMMDALQERVGSPGSDDVEE